jgi:hypothetical protein
VDDPEPNLGLGEAGPAVSRPAHSGSQSRSKAAVPLSEAGPCGSLKRARAAAASCPFHSPP